MGDTFKRDQTAFKPEKQKPTDQHSKLGDRLMNEINSGHTDQSHAVKAVEGVKAQLKLPEGSKVAGCGKAGKPPEPYLFIKGGDGKIYAVNADTGAVKARYTVGDGQNGTKKGEWKIDGSFKKSDSTQTTDQGSPPSEKQKTTLDKTKTDAEKQENKGKFVKGDDDTYVKSDGKGGAEGYVKNPDTGKYEHYTYNQTKGWQKATDSNDYSKYTTCKDTNGNLKFSDGQTNGNEKTLYKNGVTVTQESGKNEQTVKLPNGESITVAKNETKGKDSKGNDVTDVRVTEDGEVSYKDKRRYHIKVDKEGKETQWYSDGAGDIVSVRASDGSAHTFQRHPAGNDTYYYTEGSTESPKYHINVSKNGNVHIRLADSGKPPAWGGDYSGAGDTSW